MHNCFFWIALFSFWNIITALFCFFDDCLLFYILFFSNKNKSNSILVLGTKELPNLPLVLQWFYSTIKGVAIGTIKIANSTTHRVPFSIILKKSFWQKHNEIIISLYIFWNEKKLHNKIIILLCIFWGEKNYTTETWFYCAISSLQ